MTPEEAFLPSFSLQVSGRCQCAGVAVDLIEAHKWFNIAAMRGHADAARLRAGDAHGPSAFPAPNVAIECPDASLTLVDANII